MKPKPTELYPPSQTRLPIAQRDEYFRQDKLAPELPSRAPAAIKPHQSVPQGDSRPNPTFQNPNFSNSQQKITTPKANPNSGSAAATPAAQLSQFSLQPPFKRVSEKQDFERLEWAQATRPKPHDAPRVNSEFKDPFTQHKSSERFYSINTAM